jgi:hypothetical protein
MLSLNHSGYICCSSFRAAHDGPVRPGTGDAVAEDQIQSGRYIVDEVVNANPKPLPKLAAKRIQLLSSGKTQRRNGWSVPPQLATHTNVLDSVVQQS